MIYLTTDPIDPSQYRLAEVSGAVGAVAEFLGVVRDHENHNRIEALFYEIYPEMTLKELKKVVQETRHTFPEIVDIRLVHRHGKIYVGEAALWIQVASPHRREAFEAIEFCISHLKKIVPIWKTLSAS